MRTQSQLKGKKRSLLLAGHYHNVQTPLGVCKVNLEVTLGVQVWLDPEDNDPGPWGESGRDDLQRELSAICERISAIFAQGTRQAEAAAQAEFDFSLVHGLGAEATGPKT